MTSNAEVDNVAIQSIDPIGEIRCIDINNIDLFDKNPRRSRNPAYERIKASILANGLDQPLIVTKRPGEEKFVVHAGGNTRLQILKELFRNSGDPDYAFVNCIYVDWDAESAVLLAHLRENDLRGDLSFIDKAIAISALEEMLLEESGREKLSVRQLQEVLKSRGYGISNALISYMRYAVNYLLPVIPVALADGLGRRQVQKIRRLQRLGGEIWSNRGIGSTEEFDGIFSELCRRYDSPDWQIEPLTRAVETEIAEAADTGIQVIRMELDCLANGGIPPFEMHGATDEIARRHADTNVPEGHNNASNITKTDQRSAANILIEVVEAPKIVSQDSQVNDKLDALRYQSYDHAEALARRFGLGDLVLPLANVGLGFLLSDIPPKKIVDSMDDELRASMCTMWWQLLAFSETTVAPLRELESHLSSDSQLLSILRSGNSSLLFEQIRIIDPGSFADRFWCRLSQQDWHHWLQLAHSYRELHRLAIEKERPLWELHS